MQNADPNAAPATVFLLHCLGGSALTWRWVAARLPSRLRVVAIDLPGFGDAADSAGFTVHEMAEAVVARVRAEGPPNFLLAGHSMGAKVAMTVARRAEDGEAGLAGLRHLILLAGSPPCPEPMEEAQRRLMRGWFAGDDDKSRAEAGLFIKQNIGSPIAAEAHAQAVSDLLRAARPAWLAWLQGGSLEDISAEIGVLRTPALIVAGSKDETLGAQAQARLVAPHFAQVRMAVLDGAKHLLPLERPGEIAGWIEAILGDPRSTQIPPAYRALMHSERVSKATREALESRLVPDPAGRRAQAAERTANGSAPGGSTTHRATAAPCADRSGRADRCDA